MGDRALAVDEIRSLVGNDDAVQDAAVVRANLTKWIRVELLEQATGTTDPAIASTANLDARLAAGLTALAVANPDAGRERYDAGPEVSGTVCLGAIPVTPAEVAEQVLADLAGGLSFAEAAATYSSDPGLADSGGVVLNADGSECFAVTDVNPDIVGPVVEAGVGVPVVVLLGEITAVVQIRPYVELSADAQLELSTAAMNTTRLPELIAAATIYVDPRYGTWNAATADVDPLQA